MNDAPERIWVCPLDVNSGLIDWSEGLWTPYCEGVEGEHEYVLASRLAEVEADLRDYSRQVSKLEDELEEVEAERDRLAARLVEVESGGTFGGGYQALKKIQDERDRLETAHAQMQQTLDRLAREVERLVAAAYWRGFRGFHAMLNGECDDFRAPDVLLAELRAALNPEGETPPPTGEKP